MISHSHVIEDSRIERAILQNTNPTIATVVTGNGERVLALLDSTSLEQVYCLDDNPENQYHLELKLLALKKLSIDDYLHFIGHYQDPVFMQYRLHHYDELRSDLSEGARSYWNARVKDIERGILICGRFERFFGRVRPFLRLILAGGLLLTLKKPTRESVKIFPHKRFSVLFSFLSLPLIQRLFGGLDIPLQGHLSGLKSILSKGESVTSFFFHLVFVGDFRHLSTEHLPPSLKREVLTKVKSNLQNQRVKIHYRTGVIKEILQEIKGGEHSFHSIVDLKSNAESMENIFTILKENFSHPQGVIRCSIGTEIKDVKNCTQEEMTRIYSVYLL